MVPWEEKIKEAHEHMLGKYQSLTLESQQRGRRAWKICVQGLPRAVTLESSSVYWESSGSAVQPARNLSQTSAGRWRQHPEQWHNQAGRGEEGQGFMVSRAEGLRGWVLDAGELVSSDAPLKTLQSSKKGRSGGRREQLHDNHLTQRQIYSVHTTLLYRLYRWNINFELKISC